LRTVPLKQLGVPQTHVVNGVVYYEVEAFNRKFRCTIGILLVHHGWRCSF
jgi:hypothetical protein